MAPINPELLKKIQAKLDVSQNRAYGLIAEKANASYLPRHLAAVALAGDLGININKAAYATDQERLQISAARGSSPSPRAAASSAPAPSARRPGRVPRRPSKPSAPKRKSNSVMVVHGRNLPVRDAMFAKAAAVVVLLTADDEARLKKEFRKSSDAAFEKTLTGQARPNVLFEA